MLRVGSENIGKRVSKPAVFFFKEISFFHNCNIFRITLYIRRRKLEKKVKLKISIVRFI